MLILIHILFILSLVLLNFSFINCSISKITYTNVGSDYRTRRLFSYKDTIYIFDTEGVFKIDNQILNETPAAHLPNFNSVFHTQHSTTKIISLSNGNFAIGGLINNKFLEFNLDGKVIHSLALLDKKGNTKEISISNMKSSSEFFLSYVTNDFYGKIFIYDTLTSYFSEIYTAEKWQSSYYSNFECKYLHILSNILCIFSPNDVNIYYGIFTKYGQLGSSKKLIQSINEDSIKTVLFTVLTDSNKNHDVYSDIGIIYQCEGAIFVASVHLEMDINRQYTFTENAKSIKLNVDDDWDYQVNSISTVTENLFVVVVNFGRVLFFTKDLVLLGNMELSTKLEDVDGVYTGNLDMSSIFFIEYAKQSDIPDQKVLIQFNMKRCNNIYMNVNMGEIVKLTIDSLFNFEAEPDVNTDLIYPILVSKPQQGDLVGIVMENGRETQKEIELNDYNVLVSGFRFSNYEMFKYIDVDFKYYISEKIEDNFYIPSEVCEIKLHLNADRMPACNKETSIVDKTSNLCIPITENINLRIDENENQYYSKYVNMNLTSFEEYYESIIIILQKFTAQKALDNNSKYNSSIININGNNFSFYYFPDNVNDFHTGNSSSVTFTYKCKQTLKNYYKLSDDEVFYLGLFDIIENTQSYFPHHLEYILYDNSGNKMNLSLCESSNENDYVILSNALKNMDIDDILEIGHDLEKEDSIDIFDLNSPFYTDICFKFNAPNKRDTTTEIRRLEFFPNVTLCEENCIYTGVNFVHGLVKCQCPLKTEVILNRKSLYKEIDAMSGYQKQSSVLILKCFDNFFNILFKDDNCGFYIQIILLFLSIGFLLYYCLISLSKIKKRIQKVSNFTKPLAVSQLQHIEKSLLSSENSFKLSSNLNSNSRANSGKNIDYALKSFSKYNGFSGNSIISNQSKSTLFQDSTIGLNSFNANKSMASGNSTLQKKGADLFSAILWKKYWKMILIHHSIMGIIYSHNKFNRINLRSVYLCGYISLICSINGFCFTYNQIKDAYYFPNSIQSVKYALSECYQNYLIGFSVSFIIYKALFYLVFAYQKLEHLHKKTTNKEVLFHEMKKANLKVLIFFIINTLFILFNLYYCSVFCIVFTHSQTRWIICILVSLILAFIFPFVFVGILACVSSVAKMFQLNYLKKIVRVINYK